MSIDLRRIEEAVEEAVERALARVRAEDLRMLADYVREEFKLFNERFGG